MFGLHARAWADNLTATAAFTPHLARIRLLPFSSAAAGDSRCVTEPSGDDWRFTVPSIWVYQNDGSTLGEAFFKSVRTRCEHVQGDLLSQAYADVPA